MNSDTSFVAFLSVNFVCVYDSLQCGRQITQLMDEYEEAKKTLEEEAVKLRKVRLCQST